MRACSRWRGIRRQLVTRDEVGQVSGFRGRLKEGGGGGGGGGFSASTLFASLAGRVEDTPFFELDEMETRPQSKERLTRALCFVARPQKLIMDGNPTDRFPLQVDTPSDENISIVTKHSMHVYNIQKQNINIYKRRKHTHVSLCLGHAYHTPRV